MLINTGSCWLYRTDETLLAIQFNSVNIDNSIPNVIDFLDTDKKRRTAIQIITFVSKMLTKNLHYSHTFRYDDKDFQVLMAEVLV